MTKDQADAALGLVVFTGTQHVVRAKEQPDGSVVVHIHRIRLDENHKVIEELPRGLHDGFELRTDGAAEMSGAEAQSGAYVTVLYAEDGTYTHWYATRTEALEYVMGYVPENYKPEDVKDNRAITDDWGRRVSLRPAGPGETSEEAVEDIHEAYDARECGYATPEQLALLERWGY
jgi:hypothetical protein